ncbi:hypothetical protein BO1005MUT1_20004 [Hyphomicrobiales bacterium]|nr:hypothetical protein BO1005MUT1_20004 [Hyphomicrobiales bacterium]
MRPENALRNIRRPSVRKHWLAGIGIASGAHLYPGQRCRSGTASAHSDEQRLQCTKSPAQLFKLRR